MWIYCFWRQNNKRDTRQQTGIAVFEKHASREECLKFIIEINLECRFMDFPRLDIAPRIGLDGTEGQFTPRHFTFEVLFVQ